MAESATASEAESEAASSADSDRIFDGAGIAMALVQPGGTQGLLGTIHRANRALAQLSGKGLQELVGQPFHRLLQPDERPLQDALVGPVVAGAVESCNFETRLENLDGLRPWALVTVACIQDPGGRLDGLLIVQMQDISERKHAQGELEYFADHDPLTGLLHQHRFRAEVDHQLTYCRRHGGQGAVVMLDLDAFKAINDLYGHAAGDEALIAVAAALKAGSRATDRLARLGGDEFAILLPETPVAAALQHADGLLQRITEIVLTNAGAGIHLNASAGVAGFQAHDGQCGDDLVIDADLALYQAKESGRGKAVLFSESAALQEKVSSRLRWSERLRDALDHDGFVLHAKPVVDLATGAVAFYDLLIRLKGPGDTRILPNLFLATAERFGMAEEIDEWVTRRALELLQRLEPQRRRPLAIHVGWSSLLGDRYRLFLAQHLALTGLPGSLLVLEINETMAMANQERVRHFNQAIAALGCRLALVQFGAVFGSICHLQHLPIAMLKLDGSYTRGLGGVDDAGDRLIVEAVVHLAQGMGTSVVAEWVGDRPSADALLAMGVQLGQGGHLGQAEDVEHCADLRPLPPSP